MLILGISAYYHDSAAALINNGKVIAAIEEERFSRIKHDNGFPYKAIKFCLGSSHIRLEDIDCVTYYEKPLLKFERILENFIETYPFSLSPFLKSIPEWLDQKIKVEATIKKLGFKKLIIFSPHHFSHAASTFYSSPFKEAAILTVDGVGEYQTTGLWKIKKNKIEPLKIINFPHSLGLLYSTFTAYLGFRVNEDEYKVMGLAAYGKPLFVNRIHSVIDIKDDGSFQLDFEYFSFKESFSMFNRKFVNLFGPARKLKEKITERHRNIATSIQTVTEEIYFKMINYLYSITKTENLCLSGGVALNALANGKIYQKTPFKKISILGAAGDSGAAIGAGLFAYFNIFKFNDIKRKKIVDLYFGSSFSNDQIEIALKKGRLKYKKFNEKKLIAKTAKLLSKGKIIGWFQGKCEYGPRALGNRSILCRTNLMSMKAKMNNIKRREQFRPFGGSILRSQVHQYFKVPEINHWSPFMTFCFSVKKGKGEDLSAIVHADGTCRIQTVEKTNGRYFKLISQFYKITGIPCILNTSFNLGGEPIVESPTQAINDFIKTKMDYLVIGDFLVDKVNLKN
jgi:carbamoyltransferase